MTQNERRQYLIKYLLSEKEEYRSLRIPDTGEEQWLLLRSLMNVRAPMPVSSEFLTVQDDFLRQEIAAKGIVDYRSLTPCEKGIFLWQGDITLLNCDAIVNAANSGMTGCYSPCHSCIDNCIHTYAGVQLRLACSELMKAQGYEEPTGQAKITPAFNLPSRYVIHTVGPIVNGPLTAKHEQQLSSCYLSCLKSAEANGAESIAFCCISTGVFGFPNERASQIAVETVREYKKHSDIDVIFNVFKDYDLELYKTLLY